MLLRDELAQFDGKHTLPLERLLTQRKPTNSFIRDLVILVTDAEPNVQTAATWSLKKLAESGIQFKTEHLVALFGSLQDITSWLSKLHICQMLQFIPIPKGSERNLVWFLERNLEAGNKFVKAWSYHGFYELARQHKEYLEYSMEQIDRGEAEKGSAVQARIRSVRKAMSALP